MSAWPWESSDTTNTIVPAFLNALTAMERVTKDRKADLGERGAKYKYADLTSVIEVAKPTLEANDLAVSQVASDAGVQTIVMHKSGEWLSFPPLTIRTGQNTPQAQGSAITYAKRYQLLGVLGMATEDDDGAAAAVPAPKPVKTAAEREAETIRAALGKLPSDAVQAFKAWRIEQGKEVGVADLAADAEWREDVQNWLDEYEHTQQVTT